MGSDINQAETCIIHEASELSLVPEPGFEQKEIKVFSNRH